MFYKAIPVWKDNSKNKNWEFIGDDTIVHTHFKTIEDAVEAMRLDGTALRERNWEVFECDYFGLIQKRIMLKSLWKLGYFYEKINKDEFGEYYSF